MRNIRSFLSTMVLCILASGSLLAQSAQAPSDDQNSKLYSLSGNYQNADSVGYIQWNDVPCNVIWEGDSVVWFDNLFPNVSFPDGSAIWVKGTIMNQIRIMIQPQVVYRMSMDMGGMEMVHEYSVGCLQGTLDAPTGYTTFAMVNNPKDHRIEQINRDAVLVLYTDEGEIMGAAKTVFIEEVGDDMVTPPAGIEAETFLMHYTDQATGLNETTVCHIAIQNNKAWIQGMCHSIPEAWIVGTIGDFGTIMLDFGQLLGAYGHEAILYFVGVRKAEGSISKVALAYQAETGGYIMSPEYMIAETTLSLNAYAGYANIEMRPSDGTIVAPQNPWNLQVGGSYGDFPLIAFQYAGEGANGEWMVTDSLYYQVYVDDQPIMFHPDMTGYEDYASRIPCNFEHGMYFMQYPFFGSRPLPLFMLPLTADQWQTVGIQLVYACFGQEMVSDIITLANPGASIESVTSDLTDAPCYDLMGRRLSSSAAQSRGLRIQNGKKILVR